MIKGTRTDDGGINWRRILTVLGWVWLAFALMSFMSTVFGLSGHMVMGLLDGFFGAHLMPRYPWVPWAIAGAVLGLGPALWSFRPVHRRKMLVLWIPLAALAVLAIVTNIPKPH